MNVPENAPNLRTMILSSFSGIPLGSNDHITFEPNLKNVLVMEGAAYCITPHPCTVVSRELFYAGDTNEHNVVITNSVPNGNIYIGIVCENPRGHDNVTIGNLEGGSLGLCFHGTGELEFISNWQEEGRYMIENPKTQQERNLTTITLTQGVVSLMWNNEVVAYAPLDIGQQKKYRVGVSFTTSGQGVCAGTAGMSATRSRELISHLQTVPASLVHSIEEVIVHPSKASYTFVPCTSDVHVRANTLLCTSDNCTTVVTKEVFSIQYYRNTICDGCEKIPLYGNRFRCLVCKDFDFCRNCFDRFVEDPGLHPHAIEEFRCGLGGIHYSITVRIDDVGTQQRPIMIGLVPRIFDSPLKDLASQMCEGLVCMTVTDRVTIITNGEKRFSSERSPMKVGDLITIIFDGKHVVFQLSNRYLLKIPFSAVARKHGYRFAISLCGKNQAVTVVDGDFAIAVPRGALVRVTKDCQKLSDASRRCGIVAPLDYCGAAGIAVDFDDCDGTVGVALEHHFHWFPRSCVAVEKDETPLSPPTITINVGDTVVLHPCHCRTDPLIDGVKFGITGEVEKVCETEQGVLEGLSSECPKNVWVRWSTTNTVLEHVWGINRYYEVIHRIVNGSRVRRNPLYWRWGDQDGGLEGTVLGFPATGWVQVLWDNGFEEHYRWGHDNAYDVWLSSREERPTPPSPKKLVSRNQETGSSVIKESHYIPFEELHFTENQENELGRGRFGTVFRGTWDHREVAIKRVADTCSKNARDLGVVGRIAHPNVVGLLGWSEDEKAKTIYLVMELVMPGNLAKVLGKHPYRPASRGGPLGWRKFFNIAMGIAHALHYFSRQNLVHRDIKPENVLIRSECHTIEVKITDFGLAKFMKREDTQMSAVCGTPVYMSPETWNTNSRITPQSDVYSLGLLMNYMLTGKTPRTNCENMFQVLYDVMTLKNLVTPPSEIPEALQKLLTDCQNFDPKLRPTPVEIIRKLNEIENSIRLEDMLYENMRDDSSVSREDTIPISNSCLEQQPTTMGRDSDIVCDSTPSLSIAPITIADLTEKLSMSSQDAEYLVQKSELPNISYAQDSAAILFDIVSRYVMSVASVVTQTQCDPATIAESAAGANCRILTINDGKYLLSTDYSVVLSVLALKKKTSAGPSTMQGLTYANFSSAVDVAESQIQLLVDRGIIKPKKITSTIFRIPMSDVEKVKDCLLDMDIVLKQVGLSAAEIGTLARQLNVPIFERPSAKTKAILQQDVMEAILPHVASSTMICHAELLEHIGIDEQGFRSLVRRGILEDQQFFARAHVSDLTLSVMGAMVPYTLVRDSFMSSLQINEEEFKECLDGFVQDGVVLEPFAIRGTLYMFKADREEIEKSLE